MVAGYLLVVFMGRLVSLLVVLVDTGWLLNVFKCDDQDLFPVFFLRGEETIGFQNVVLKLSPLPKPTFMVCCRNGKGSPCLSSTRWGGFRQG